MSTGRAIGTFPSRLQDLPRWLEGTEGFSALDGAEQDGLKALVRQHATEANSSLAQAMLADWESRAKAFVRLTPKPQV